MIKIMIIIGGILMCLLALWGGFYISHILPDDHWADFPILITTTFIFIGGYALVMWGAITYQDTL